MTFRERSCCRARSRRQAEPRRARRERRELNGKRQGAAQTGVMRIGSESGPPGLGEAATCSGRFDKREAAFE
eukprot:CAMPEP_0197418274 /NCGR_PEP_ID=MMETSP1170-20131217/4054_1 /TAXON_ID=54406 /ORGANISM="Sarcinochrysis sp, Strain CCMP770" /LENGTH=71 /DNA_ID=CAMNT_0042945301 /DNA_START=82 /DNA_END=294 /DNA_ORIENTATION=-